MPKLRKITVYIETLNKHIEAHSSYSEKRFRVALGPEYMDFAESLGPQDGGTYRGPPRTKTISEKNIFGLMEWRTQGKRFIGTVGDTEDEAVERWQNFIIHFYAQAQKVERVILYSISFRSLQISGGHGYYGQGESAGAKYKRDKTIRLRACDADSSEGEAKIGFEFLVCEKRTIGKDSNFFYTDYEGNTDKVRGEWKILPYTPEAEAFFAGVYSGLESIMEKFSVYLGTEARAIKSIASSQKLLS